MIASLSQLENAARAQRLRSEADLLRVRARIHAESTGALRTARQVRETALWPHSLCLWLSQHADRSAASLEALSKAADSLEHDRRCAGELQQRWTSLRRGLERRVLRRARP